MAKPIEPTEAPDWLPQHAVSIDPVLIRDEYIRLPGDLAAWNAKYAEAFEAYLRADAAYDATVAQLGIEWRETLSEMSKPTVDAIKERIATDPRYDAARAARITAEVEKVRVRGTVDAILAKRDMLVSLGAHMRAELQDPSVRAQAHDANT